MTFLIEFSSIKSEFLLSSRLSHPDYTVGTGILCNESPVQPLKQRVADYTAGWEFHPTPKIYYFFHILI